MKMIKLFYKIDDNKIKIKLFNEDYVKRKKIKFKIICNNKLYPFKEEYAFSKNKSELLKIKILLFSQINNLSTLIKNFKPLPIDHFVTIYKYRTRRNNYYEYLKGSIYSFSMITYKFYRKQTYTRIFGEKFVENNKDKCAIIYQNGIHSLTSKIKPYIDNFFYINYFTIILIEFKSIDDKSYMFHDCYTLIGFSLPNYEIKTLGTISEREETIINSQNSEIFDKFYKKLGALTFERLSTSYESSSDKISLFEGYSKVTFSVDLSKWNTCNCVNMSKMFCGCEYLVKLPDMSNWDTHNCKDLSHMFCGCKELNILPDISNWNISKVTDLSYSFVVVNH